MSALEWESKPELDKPVLIAAFAGWNDAGEAATMALGHLGELWRAKTFATIDPEDFFDFTATRPTVTLDGGVTRKLEWPVNVFSAASVPGRGRDIVFLDGVEPQLKWKTFSAAVTECAEAMDVSMVIMLGALLADVPHTRPSPVTGTTTSASLLERADLQLSQYQGPTGITGVLHDYLSKTGIASASLWAAVPHYVGQTPSPKAALALIRRTASLLDVPVDVAELEVAATNYEQGVTEVVEEDDDMVNYVAQLEASSDEERLHSDSLVAEAEKFLRDQES